jgi:hypothetical protein
MAATSRKAVALADRIHLSEGSDSKRSDRAITTNWFPQEEVQ